MENGIRIRDIILTRKCTHGPLHPLHPLQALIKN